VCVVPWASWVGKRCGAANEGRMEGKGGDQDYWDVCIDVKKRLSAWRVSSLSRGWVWSVKEFYE
jgi:hypothetical protein